MITIDESLVRIKGNRPELITDFKGICVKLFDLGFDVDLLLECVKTRDDVRPMFKNIGETYINGEKQTNKSH